MAGKWLPLKPVQTGTAQFLWSIKLQWCDFSIFMIFFFSWHATHNYLSGKISARWCQREGWGQLLYFAYSTRRLKQVVTIRYLNSASFVTYLAFKQP